MTNHQERNGLLGPEAIAKIEMAVRPKLMPLKMVCEVWGISVSTLRRECQSGRLKHYRLRPSANSPIMIMEEDIQTWLNTYAASR